MVDRETGEIVEREEAGAPGTPDVRVDPRFIQQRQGKPFATYAGLLDLLHRQSKSCFSIDTLVVQLPTEENGRVAVCTARVRVFDAQNLDVVTLETSGIGDADPTNVSAQMRGHLLRMAETRAKARALRDAVNVGMAALEELGPDEAPERREPERDRGSLAINTVTGQVEGIVLEGRRFTRPQVEEGWRLRRAKTEALGIAIPPDLASLQPGAPLPDLAGATQQLRRLCEATQAGQR